MKKNTPSVNTPYFFERTIDKNNWFNQRTQLKPGADLGGQEADTPSHFRNSTPRRLKRPHSCTILRYPFLRKAQKIWPKRGPFWESSKIQFGRPEKIVIKKGRQKRQKIPPRPPFEKNLASAPDSNDCISLRSGPILSKLSKSTKDFDNQITQSRKQFIVIHSKKTSDNSVALQKTQFVTKSLLPYFPFGTLKKRTKLAENYFRAIGTC